MIQYPAVTRQPGLSSESPLDHKQNSEIETLRAGSVRGSELKYFVDFLSGVKFVKRVMLICKELYVTSLDEDREIAKLLSMYVPQSKSQAWPSSAHKNRSELFTASGLPPPRKFVKKSRSCDNKTSGSVAPDLTLFDEKELSNDSYDQMLEILMLGEH